MASAASPRVESLFIAAPTLNMPILPPSATAASGSDAFSPSVKSGAEPAVRASKNEGEKGWPVVRFSMVMVITLPAIIIASPSCMAPLAMDMSSIMEPDDMASWARAGPETPRRRMETRAVVWLERSMARSFVANAWLWRPLRRAMPVNSRRNRCRLLCSQKRVRRHE
jgi:hypothetical protein